MQEYISELTLKIEIKRHYQDIMEFYADNSILLDLINFFCIIFSFINDYLSYNSIMNKIFYFEKDKEKFKCFEDFKEIPMYNKFTDPNLIKNKIYNINKYDKNDTDISFSNGSIGTTLNRYKRYEISNCNRFRNWLFFCCKRKYPENPIDIIDAYLDVVFYIKNMLLSRLINKINFEDNQSFMNFLSVLPIIHQKRGNENDSIEENEEELYQNTEQLDINKVSQEMRTILYKNNKTEKEIKMIKIFNKQINE